MKSVRFTGHGLDRHWERAREVNLALPVAALRALQGDTLEGCTVVLWAASGHRVCVAVEASELLIVTVLPPRLGKVGPGRS